MLLINILKYLCTRVVNPSAFWFDSGREPASPPPGFTVVITFRALRSPDGSREDWQRIFTLWDPTRGRSGNGPNGFQMYRFFDQDKFVFELKGGDGGGDKFSCSTGEFDIEFESWATYAIWFRTSVTANPPTTFEVRKIVGDVVMIVKSGSCSEIIPDFTFSRGYLGASTFVQGELNLILGKEESYFRGDVAGFGLYKGVMSDDQILAQAQAFMSTGDGRVFEDPLVLGLFQSDIVPQPDGIRNLFVAVS